jgi:hypothetical protein
VKRYRDVERGGVIGFIPALGLALLIALIATIAYTSIWELYLAATHYRFMDDYIASILAKARASGKSAAEIAGMKAELDGMRAMYANPLIRLPMTAMEVAPVGLAVSLFSAGLLCNPRLLRSRENVRAASLSRSPTDPA